MDKGVTAAVMVQVKRKPSELFALGSSRLFWSVFIWFIRSGRLALTVIRSNNRNQFAKARSCYSDYSTIELQNILKVHFKSCMFSTANISIDAVDAFCQFSAKDRLGHILLAEFRAE